ncbi:MAG TPA: hypothetical protein VF540_03430 [Segetibacter sp.]
MFPSLTTYEMQLVTDPQVLVTKNSIIKKVYEIFGELAEKYKKEISNKIPDSKTWINPKISKGENYKGLPYVILDFPRQFNKIDIFAIRSFFWWGNFFSITLQLAGRYHQQYTTAIKNAIDLGFYEEWYIGLLENQWEHHFESNNYSSLSRGINYDIAKLPYLKLAKKIPLNKWDETNTFFIKNFTLLAETLGSMHQFYEKGL